MRAACSRCGLARFRSAGRRPERASRGESPALPLFNTRLKIESKMNANLPATMSVVEISTRGGPEVLRLTRRPTPQPGSGQVLIRVFAAAVIGREMQRVRAARRRAGHQLSH